MEGTQLLVDDHGNPTSVIVDLSILGDKWEHIYEVMRAEVPGGGTTMAWDEVKAELRAAEAFRNSDAYLEDFDGEDECSDEIAAASECTMKGVQYITDEQGNPTSVALDLAIWSDVWEDIYDIKMLEALREEEDEGEWVPWEVLEAELDAKLAAMNAEDTDAADD